MQAPPAHSHSSSVKLAVTLRGWLASNPDPSVALLAGHPPDRRLDAPAGRDLAPHVAQQRKQVPLLRVQGLGPGGGRRAVAGHHPRRRHEAQIGNHVEPSLEAAVHDRQPVDEQQIAGEQGPGAQVEDGQVVVGVRGSPGGQNENAAAEVDPGLVGDFNRRGDDAGPFERPADETLERIEVEGAAQRQRTGELAVSRERDAVFIESDAAEDMVGVRVGGDHVGNGPVGQRLDACAQAPTELGAAAGVDDRDRMRSDYHPRVADRTQVQRARILVRSRVDVDPLGDFLEREGLDGAGSRAERERGRKRERPVRSGAGAARRGTPSQADAGSDRFDATAETGHV